LAEELIEAVRRANEAVHEESLKKTQLGGMGTTCTALLVRGRELYIAHVGDSRAYLLRNGAMRALTRDHSLVAQLVREGMLTPEAARTDPRRNVVTRSVGVSASVDVDGGREAEPLAHGDTLLVCSDGLHGVVEDDDLAAVAAGPDLEVACREAIALANEHGGPDNISIVLARVEIG
jgi:protein phosphatase